MQLVIDAFHACERDDLQLFIARLGDERVPDDPRIFVQPNEMISDTEFYRRLVALVVLVFPFDEGMLMTGTAFDAIGGGKAALTSNWPVLAEVFGDAAIRYGETRQDLTACLEGLTADGVAAAGLAAAALQPLYDWSDIAERTLALVGG